MRRRTRTLREAREEAEAAEARGLVGPGPRPARPRDEEPARPKPRTQPRMRIVWAVCDVGGRTVATFAYADKAQAEAHMLQLQASGKDQHFLRAIKEPM